MSDDFTPLAAFLRPVVAESVAEPLPAAEAQIARPRDDYVETLRAARRFRAGLADALDIALARLLRAIANEVLARELALGGADVAAIVVAALERFSGETVLRLRAHPHDYDALAGLDIERIADDMLHPGDIRMELRSGTIDLTLAVRLDDALAACCA